MLLYLIQGTIVRHNKAIIIHILANTKFEHIEKKSWTLIFSTPEPIVIQCEDTSLRFKIPWAVDSVTGWNETVLCHFSGLSNGEEEEAYLEEASLTLEKCKLRHILVSPLQASTRGGSLTRILAHRRSWHIASRDKGLMICSFSWQRMSDSELFAMNNSKLLVEDDDKGLSNAKEKLSDLEAWSFSWWQQPLSFSHT